ncbi:MAG: hypothetical protein R3C53_03240 [Pirellulaceae bacterium]
MNQRNVTLSLCMLFATSFCGCQSWNPMGFPMQNMSRVPPPGTGTYPVPNGYYNNGNASVSPNGQFMSASTNPVNTSNSTGLRPASGGLPTTNLVSSPQQPNGFSQNPVQPAQYTQPASGIAFQPNSSVSANDFQNGGFQPQIVQGGNLNEPSYEPSNLQWQSQ